jgi:small subunit ribosomal protein S1
MGFDGSQFFRNSTQNGHMGYGIFVDLDGVDGLLHIADMSLGHISHPGELVRMGEEVEVVIFENDIEKERITLGMKQTKNNLWDNIEHRYPIGR